MKAYEAYGLQIACVTTAVTIALAAATQFLTRSGEAASLILGGGSFTLVFIPRMHPLARAFAIATTIAFLDMGGWLDFERWRLLLRGLFGDLP